MMIITPEEYLKDERIEDVLVDYSVPPKAENRLRKLQEALYHTRECSIKENDLPVLEGILLFGSFTRGKEEPGDIDIVPFIDFSQYEPEEDNFRVMVNKANRINDLIWILGKYYKKIGGTPYLGRLCFKQDYCPHDYLDCTTDIFLARDYQLLRSFFLNAGWCSYIEPKRRFKPSVEHVLGPKRLKEQFKRILTS